MSAPRLVAAPQKDNVLELFEGRSAPLVSRRAFLGRAAMATGALALPSFIIACGGSEPAAMIDSGVAVGKADPMAPERLFGWVKELCAFQPRWAGYPEERRAGEWLAQRLSNAGLQTQIEPYGFRKWELIDWETFLTDGSGMRAVNSFPMWSTHAGQGTAELVDVGFGTEVELLAQDLQGKAVVVTGKALLNVFATYPDTYQRAAELGAAAMFVTSDAPDNLIRPTSSSQNYLDDNPIPAFQMGARDIAEMRAAARNGGTATWRLNAQHVDGTTRDVVGFLPGSGELDGTLLICAHYDAWFTGALDNATGVAGLIGLAEHFGSLPIEQRPRDMIFVGVTGHDTGFPYGGIANWLSKNQDLVPNLDLFVNLDHLAAYGEEHISGAGIIDMLGLMIERPGDEERALFTTKHPALQRTFLPYLLQYGLLAVPLPTVPEVNANRDLEGSMGALDVPSVNLTMATPHYHTVEDTPDRIPPEQLSRAVRAHRDFLTDIIGMSRQQIRSPL
ncbi:M28 family peptidase [Sinimarinibacterium sp. CAU 1509]|uniref:M28 family peptidase n=1 Tax=Sinimarinibacterium sp. CAU 1509 TaxID=2562283 RepID=UPI0010AB7DBD|nr:M28 family peptidase [Sinimarinibacterium sp. CAU 1509]TJY59989.1 M28 family peptidase [Sinimarinibacterium sp. CAU 1509]